MPSMIGKITRSSTSVTVSSMDGQRADFGASAQSNEGRG